MKAIILSGGKGTRFLPLTEKIPKALIPLGDGVLIKKVIETLPEIIDTVIVTTDYLGDLIEKEVGNSFDNKKILYSRQSENLKGTWPAFYSAKKFFSDQDELFCVLGCDDFFKKEELQKILSGASIGLGVSHTKMPAKYHGVEFDVKNIWTGLKRHNDENRENLVEDFFVNGFFVLNKEAFNFKGESLIDGEIGLPQTLLKNKEVYPLKVFVMNYWQPCNTPKDLRILNEEFDT